MVAALSNVLLDLALSHFTAKVLNMIGVHPAVVQENIERLWMAALRSEQSANLCDVSCGIAGVIAWNSLKSI